LKKGAIEEQPAELILLVWDVLLRPAGAFKILVWPPLKLARSSQWLQYPRVHCFLVNWGDLYESVLCCIHLNTFGSVTAAELILRALDRSSYVLEGYVVVSPIASATDDWHDDAGPLFALLFVQGCMLLAKYREWKSEEYTEHGCYITVL